MFCADLAKLLEVRQDRLLPLGVAGPLHEPTVVRVACAGHGDLVAVVDQRDALGGEQHGECRCESFVSRSTRRLRGLVAPVVRLAAVPDVAAVGRIVLGHVNHPRQIVVAYEGAHDRRRAVVAVVAIHEAFEIRHRRLAGQHGVRELRSRREVELPVEHRGAHVLLDRPLIPRVRLAHHVEVIPRGRLDLGLHTRSQIDQPLVLDVLDRVEPEAVDPRLLDPPQRVVHRVLARIGVGEVEVRQVVAEPAAPGLLRHVPRAALAADAVAAAPAVRPEPVGVVLVDLRVLVDVVHRVVEDHPDVLGMRRVDQRLELRHRAESRLGLRQIRGPIAVIRRVHVAVVAHAGHIGVLHRHRQPERVDTQIGEVPVVDLLQHPGPVATLVVGLRLHIGNRRAVVRRVAVEEPIDEHEVEHRIAPVVAALRRAAGPPAARRVLQQRVAVGLRSLRIARIRDPRRAVDHEFVLDRHPPRDVHERLPQVAVLHHRHAVGPPVGLERAADLHRVVPSLHGLLELVRTRARTLRAPERSRIARAGPPAAGLGLEYRVLPPHPVVNLIGIARIRDPRRAVDHQLVLEAEVPRHRYHRRPLRSALLERNPLLPTVRREVPAQLHRGLAPRRIGERVIATLVLVGTHRRLRLLVRVRTAILTPTRASAPSVRPVGPAPTHSATGPGVEAPASPRIVPAGSRRIVGPAAGRRRQGNGKRNERQHAQEGPRLHEAKSFRDANPEGGA